METASAVEAVEKSPNKFFVWFACKENEHAWGVSVLLLMIVGIICGNIMANRSYSHAVYPGATTLRIKMYVPEKLQAGTFDPNRAVAIEDVSLGDFKKRAEKLPHVFSSQNIRQAGNVIVASVSYYAKSENATHAYRVSIEKEIPAPESSSWEFKMQNFMVQPWGVQINGSYEKTNLKGCLILIGAVVAFLFSIALHLSANYCFGKRYPKWRSS